MYKNYFTDYQRGNENIFFSKFYLFIYIGG